jgi:hypothetical protein
MKNVGTMRNFKVLAENLHVTTFETNDLILCIPWM